MPITLSNGHKLEFVVASGALGFDGRGWLWDRPFIWLGLIDPTLFTIVGKSITFNPLKGNLHWSKPWGCVRWIKDGVVNKVGLTNPGFDVWMKKIVPRINFDKMNFVPSLFGSQAELLTMVLKSNHLKVAAYELNVSCPNTDHASDEVDAIVRTVKNIKCVTDHPLILKLSVKQNYLAIAEETLDVVEAISLNSVPWDIACADKPSPLAGLPGPGGGGVSGKAAQHHNWNAVKLLKQRVPRMPVIGPSVWDYPDVLYLLDTLHADAISFGAIHLKVPFGPVLPTQYVCNYLETQNQHQKERCLCI